MEFLQFLSKDGNVNTGDNSFERHLQRKNLPLSRVCEVFAAPYF